MKYILSKIPLAVLLILISTLSNAQSTPKIVASVSSGVADHLIHEGKIVVDPYSDISQFMFNIGIERRADAVDKPFEVKGKLIIVSNGVDHVVSEEIIFNGSDFTPSWSIMSAAKQYLVTLTAPNKIGTIKFKYSEKVDNIWGPDLVSNDLGDTKHPVTNQVPHITGSDFICSSEIYVAIPTNSITWDLNDIATVESTAAAHYRISRIGNRSGKIRIISRLGGQTQTKEIIVGTLPPTSITGPSFSLDWSRNYTFTVNTVNPNEILEIVKEGAANVTFTRLDNNRFRINTPPRPPATGGTIPRVLLLNIKARVLNPECGPSEFLNQEIRVGTTVPFN